MMPEPVQAMSKHAASLIGACNLAVVLWLGSTVQELDKALPLIMYRLDVIEARQDAQASDTEAAALDLFALRTGIDKPVLLNP